MTQSSFLELGVSVSASEEVDGRSIKRLGAVVWYYTNSLEDDEGVLKMTSGFFFINRDFSLLVLKWNKVNA